MTFLRFPENVSDIGATGGGSKVKTTLSFQKRAFGPFSVAAHFHKYPMIQTTFISDQIPEPDWSLIVSDQDQHAAASDYWHLTLAEMRQAGTLSPANAPQIKRYVLTLLLYDLQATALFDEGTVRVVSKKTGAKVTNCRWMIYKDCNTISTALEESLGLTPRRLGSAGKVSAPKPKSNPAEAFLKVV